MVRKKKVQSCERKCSSCFCPSGHGALLSFRFPALRNTLLLDIPELFTYWAVFNRNFLLNHANYKIMKQLDYFISEICWVNPNPGSHQQCRARASKWPAQTQIRGKIFYWNSYFIQIILFLYEFWLVHTCFSILNSTFQTFN